MVTGQQAEAWLGVAVNLGAFGLVAWLVKHTFTHTIPRLAKEFREQLDAQRTAFSAELKDQRAAFREELREERQCHCDKLDHMTCALHRLADTVKDRTDHA